MTAHEFLWAFIGNYGPVVYSFLFKVRHWAKLHFMSNLYIWGGFNTHTSSASVTETY